MQKNSLAGKVALITGAARRVGAEIARVLHEAGMNTALHYNASEEEAQVLAEELNRKRKGSAVALRADLLEPESEKLLVNQAVKAWGRLDALVNNASRFYRTELGKVTDYSWDDLLNSNLKAPFFLSQAAASHLAEHHGCIINITDINAERPLKNYSVYCMSKAGLNAMTSILAKELGPKVRVNAVAPGSVMWPEGPNSMSEEEKRVAIERTPLLRHGEPLDIAKAVLFFIRDADYVTGQVLAVDGGRILFG
jgi:pteridine reductase